MLIDNEAVGGAKKVILQDHTQEERTRETYYAEAIVVGTDAVGYALLADVLGDSDGVACLNKRGDDVVAAAAVEHHVVVKHCEDSIFKSDHNRVVLNLFGGYRVGVVVAATGINVYEIGLFIDTFL